MGWQCQTQPRRRSRGRHLIENRAVAPVPDSAKAKIIAGRGVRTTCNDVGLELLYPDIETHHAVVSRYAEQELGLRA
jgi:hypothetical protein